MTALVATLALALPSCSDAPSSLPMLVAVEGWLMNVRVLDDGDVVAVGGTPASGMVMRRTRRGWESLAIGHDVPLLNWVHDFDDGSPAWIVGARGTILRFDGMTFERDASPTDADLWGVWGARSDSVWAVGGSGRAGSEPTLLHYDGSAWRSVALPPLEREGVHALYKVWGTSEDGVYAVGQRGIVLRFDGHAWREQALDTRDDLIAVWGSASGEVVVVGGRSNGVAARFDGESWRVADLAPLSGLNGVWSPTAGLVYAVGQRGTFVALDSLSLAVVHDHSVATNLDLHAIFGDESRVLSVGGSLGVPSPPYEGVIVERTSRDVAQAAGREVRP